MFGNRGKFFSLKLTIISLVCFLFGLSCASLFVFNQKQTQNVNAVSIETEETNEIDDSALILKWDKNKKPNKTIKPLSKTNKTGSNEFYKFDTSNIPDVIYGGTKISISGSVITFNDGTNPPYTATVEMGDDYIFKGFQIGCKENGTEKYYNSSNVTPIISITDVTTETLDPNYSGELFFKVVWDYKPYGLDLFYKLESGNYMDINHEIKTGCDGTDPSHYEEWENNDIIYYNDPEKVVTFRNEVEDPGEDKKPNNGATFRGWVFDECVASSNGYTITADENNEITVEGAHGEHSSVDLTFGYSDSFTNSTCGHNHKYYIVTSVYGSGSLWQNAAPQSDEKPIIFAAWTNIYNFTIVSGESDWENVTTLPTGVYVNNLYGVGSYGKDLENEQLTETSITVANSSTYAYQFMDDVMDSNHSVFGRKDTYLDNADYRSTAGSNYYYVFNYGYHITDYTVTVGSQYLNLDASGKFSLSSSGTISVDITNSGTTFDKIVAYLDMVYLDGADLPTVTITPTWAKQQFSVKYVGGSEDNLEILTDYTLTAQTSSGQTQVAYKSDEFKIAMSGNWNYCSEGVSDIYEYVDDIVGYVVKVEPEYLNNVYKINLNTPCTIESNKYQLNTGHEFYSGENIYSQDCYTFKDSSILGGDAFEDYDAWDDGTNKPIDDYIAKLEEYITNWATLTDRANDDCSDIFKNVHYTSGTPSADGKTLSDASEASFYIYLTNDEGLGDTVMPGFASDYQNLIFWKLGTNVFKTSNYENDFVKEIDDEDNAEDNNYTAQSNWILNYGVNATPYYVYRADLYYENNIESLDTVKSQWYGTYTSTEIPNLQVGDDEKPADHTFGSWMFNAEVAVNENNRWAVNYDKYNDENKTGYITASKDGVTLTMTVTGKNPFHNYYYISHLQGEGVVVQDDPFLTAKWSKLYDLTVDIQGTSDWDSVGYNGLIDDTTKNELRGVYHSSYADIDSASVTFKIANAEGYEYPFFDSEYTKDGTQGLSFWKQSDWEQNLADASYVGAISSAGSNYYYLYNYGYYISGYYLKLDTSHYLTKNAGEWGCDEGTGIPIDIDSLVGTGENLASLANFAEYADEYFAYDMNKSITLIPVWSAVSIEAKSEIDTVITTSFNSLYSATQLVAPAGKSLFAYAYDENDVNNTLIASVANNYSNAGVWNYHSISYGEYTSYTTSDGNIGKGTYTLPVTPVFLDNIYKVTLNDVKPSGTNTYTLTSECSYTFNDSNGAYTENDISCLTFANKYTGYQFEKYSSSSYPLMDSYIDDLKNWKGIFEEGIDGDSNNDFNIFRKVYYSVGSKTDNLTLNSSETPTFNIYLANGQKTGEMPVFNKDYYALIFWKNDNEHTACNAIDCTDGGCANNGKTFVYKTHMFDDSLHASEIKEDEHAVRNDDIWYYTDGSNGGEVSFTSHYFRKYYELDIQTLFDGNIDRRGYVHVSIVDWVYHLDLIGTVDNTINDRGGEYVIIASKDNPGTMVIYKAVDGYWENDFNSLTGTYIYDADNGLKGANLLTDDELIKNDHLLLYEGCNLNFYVKDQSKDPKAMHTGSFDEMIGYKYSGEITQSSEKVDKALFNISTGYNFDIGKDDVADIGYENGEKITITVPFEKIVYKVKFEIDDKNAGEFEVYSNLVSSAYQKEPYTLENRVVGDTIQVSYFSFAGYALEYKAFIITNKANSVVAGTLQEYDEEGYKQSVDAGNENLALISQKYILSKGEGETSLNAEWLRKFFYNDYETNPDSYNVTFTDLGTITIKTDPIEFKLDIKVYESNDGVDPWELIETTENFATFKFESGNGYGFTAKFDSCLKSDLGFFYYQHSETVGEGDNKEEVTTNYALLSSRMFFPANYTKTNDNHYTQYDFLLENAPDKQFKLNPNILSYMVNNYSRGVIIPSSNRQIYIMLEVRELLEITMKVQALANDTNSKTRTTTLTNGTNNNKNIEVASSAIIESGYFKTSNGTTEVKAYTYDGLINKLTSVFDSKRYVEAEYYLNGSVEPLETSNFVVEEDSLLIIKYIPSSLKVEYAYTVDGVSVPQGAVSNYITDNSATISRDMVIGDEFTYSILELHPDYNVIVVINNNTISATIDGNIMNYAYTVNNFDYDYERILINVIIKMKDNSKINVRYQLIDYDLKHFIDDEYGTMTVYENNIAKAENVEQANDVTIIVGRNVDFEISLNAGYVYSGIKHGTNEKTAPALVGSKISAITNYNPEVDCGDYLILIDKVTISAILNTDGLLANYYINGKTSLANLYVGQEINLTCEEVNEERLGCFFYTYEDPTLGTQYVYLTNDGTQTGTPNTTFKITSEVITRCGTTINLGVVPIKRYKFNLTLEGVQYLKENSLKLVYNKVGFPGYVSGTYCDSGTEITLAAETIIEGKYNITFNSNVYDRLGFGNEIITLDENVSKTLKIEPKVYSVNVSETVYNTLEQFQGKNPEEVEEENDWVNGILDASKQQKYNIKATIEIQRIANDRELHAIHVSGNDGEDIVVILSANSLNAYINYGTGAQEEISLSDYGMSIQFTQPEKIQFTYTPLNHMNLRLDYKLYKIISA